MATTTDMESMETATGGRGRTAGQASAEHHTIPRALQDHAAVVGVSAQPDLYVQLGVLSAITVVYTTTLLSVATQNDRVLLAISRGYCSDVETWPGPISQVRVISIQTSIITK